MTEGGVGAVAPDLVSPGTTRRRAVAGLLAAAAGFAGLHADSEAKKKAKKRRRRNKRNRKRWEQWAANPALQTPNVALGAYVPRVLDDPAVLRAFQDKIGRSLAFAIWYENWEYGNFDASCARQLAYYDTHGMTPVIAWHPSDTKGHPVNQPKYRLANILRGDFDGYIDSWIAGLKAYGKPVYLKFAHEMNGDWTVWGVGVNGNKPGEYITVWRYLHDRFRRAGVTNVVWVWNPNVAVNGIAASLQEVYPGDAYVDWVGMNGYNWGTSVYWESCPCQSKWESFSKVFDRTYQQLVALTDKPIFIGEFASSEEGGNKAHWIRSALLDELPSKYPRIKAITWFSKKATGLDTKKNGQIVSTAAVDWRIDSSKKARKAFAASASYPYYQAKLR